MLLAVATFAVGAAGAHNAGLYAVAVLAPLIGYLPMAALAFALSAGLHEPRAGRAQLLHARAQRLDEMKLARIELGPLRGDTLHVVGGEQTGAGRERSRWRVFSIRSAKASSTSA